MGQVFGPILLRPRAGLLQRDSQQLNALAQHLLNVLIKHPLPPPPASIYAGEDQNWVRLSAP